MNSRSLKPFTNIRDDSSLITLRTVSLRDALVQLHTDIMGLAGIFIQLIRHLLENPGWWLRVVEGGYWCWILPDSCLINLDVECWYWYWFGWCWMLDVGYIYLYYIIYILFIISIVIIYYNLFKHYLLIHCCYSYDYHCWYWTFYQQYFFGGRQLLFYEDHLPTEDQKILVYQETGGNCPKEFHTEKSCTTWGCSNPARKFVGKSLILIYKCCA